MSKKLQRARKPRLGEYVSVHANINDGSFSITAREGKDKGYVIAWVESVTLRNAEFRVEPSGPSRVRENESKDVHARVFGYISDEFVEEGSSLRYNPYDFDYFHERSTGRALQSADRVSFTIDHEGRHQMIGTGLVFQGGLE